MITADVSRDGSTSVWSSIGTLNYHNLTQILLYEIYSKGVGNTIFAVSCCTVSVPFLLSFFSSAKQK
jgi:hypothetical protein